MAKDIIKGEKKRIRPWRFHLFRSLRNSIFGRPGWCPQLLRDQGRFMPTNCGWPHLCNLPVFPCGAEAHLAQILCAGAIWWGWHRCAATHPSRQWGYCNHVYKRYPTVERFCDQFKSPGSFCYTIKSPPRCRTAGGLWCGSCVGVRCVKLSGSSCGFWSFIWKSAKPCGFRTSQWHCQMAFQITPIVASWHWLICYQILLGISAMRIS